MDSEALDAECRLRERFIQARLCRPASPAERKDLTDFFHAGPAELASCTTCGQLLRRELAPLPAPEYSKETYDPAVIEAQYPRYVNAFRAKADPYRRLVPPPARVLEVGSHYGAFLQTAAEWGWNAVGVDVGQDTTRFARSKGFTVHNCDLPSCGFASGSFDAVFIWNCFEQIDDPAPLLRESQRILEPGGLLVLRAPNGLFYRLCRDYLNSHAPGESTALLIEALAYNNLLGFPYLYGYDAEGLARCASHFGFSSHGMLNSELLTLPLPEDPDWVKREERVVSDQLSFLAQWTLRSHGALIGPWVECWFRSGETQIPPQANPIR